MMVVAYEKHMHNHRFKLGENSVWDVRETTCWRRPYCCPVCGQDKLYKLGTFACGFGWSGQRIVSYCRKKNCSCKVGTLMKYGCVCDGTDKDFHVIEINLSMTDQCRLWDMGITRASHLIEFTAAELFAGGISIEGVSEIQKTFDGVGLRLAQWKP